MSDRGLYDRISEGYAQARRGDARIEGQIHSALGDAATVLNVGAGTGNYELSDRLVVALEPSTAMIAQRAADAAPVVRGVAEHLPFPDGSFDVAMATLTVHHWPEVGAGLREMARVAPRQVIFGFDAAEAGRMWLLDYFGAGLDAPSERNAPTASDVAQHLDVFEVQVVPVPADCIDGFGHAYWARPHAYLQPAVQASISLIAQMSPDARAAASAHLARDLESGAWDERYGHLRTMQEIDCGYRLVVAGQSQRGGPASGCSAR